MVEEVSRPHPWKSIEEAQGDTDSGNFEAKVRYISSTLIVTIPANVARELGIKLGDRVLIQVRKKQKVDPAVTPQGQTSTP